MAAKPIKKRTASGAPSAAERKATGGGSGMAPGSFPVFDSKSAHSALRLRGRASNSSAVVNKVAAFAARTNDPTLKAAVKKARSADKSK